MHILIDYNMLQQQNYECPYMKDCKSGFSTLLTQKLREKNTLEFHKHYSFGFSCLLLVFCNRWKNTLVNTKKLNSISTLGTLNVFILEI